MPDISQAIISRLTGDVTVFGLVNDRVSPFKADQASTRPYITYNLINMGPRPHAMGSDPPLVTDRYQVDLWADTYAETIALDDAVMAMLSRWRGIEAGVTIQSSFHVDRRDFYEPDTELYRRSLDFEISWNEQ